MDKHVADYSVDDFYYLSRAALVKDERNLDKFDQVFGHVFKGLEALPAEGVDRRDPRGVAAQARREAADRRGEGADRGDGRLGQADGDAEEAPRGAEEAPRGRQQVDRHRRHLAVRRLRLQSRGRAHRPGQEPQRQRGQGLGQARVQEPRRHASSSARATSRSRCAACASSRARAPRTSSTCADTIRSTARNAGYLDIKMLPERRNKVKVLLLFDIGGSMDAHIRVCEELFSRGAHRVQAPRVLLLPQLPLRERVEGQPPPPRREHARPGTAAAQVSATTTR